jgi:hypothetical protein
MLYLQARNKEMRQQISIDRLNTKTYNNGLHTIGYARLLPSYIKIIRYRSPTYWLQ